MMRVLYISDRWKGGIVSHVKCLTECLSPEVERFVIGFGGDEGFAGRSGHDWREWFQIRRVIKAFEPDVIHFHTNPLFMELYVKLFFHGRVVCSIHTPSVRRRPEFSRRLVNWAAEPCYWLPVSCENWRNFKACYPRACGEVFFNPIRIGIRDRGLGTPTIRQSNNFIVGMVGRNAVVKDWPSFCKVAETVKRGGLTEIVFWGVGVSEGESKSFGVEAERVEWKGLQPNGQEWIGKMDLLLLTSESEEMPTVVLEAFLSGTPVCGFMPRGGMSDILSLSSGALREVFIQERDCERLAKIVARIRGDADLRKRVVEDGWQILVNHFDAEKNVRGRLMDIYRNRLIV